MNRRLKACTADFDHLNKMAKESPQVSYAQPSTYRDLVVLKPWGHEFLAFENEFVSIWVLNIRPGHATSMHCHMRKRTSLTVLSGRGVCATFAEQHPLTALDNLVIERESFHSIRADEKIPLTLIETETPPDKTDLVRVKDRYGREQSGYEPLAKMATTELHQYDHCQFTEGQSGEQRHHSSEGTFNLSLIHLSNPKELVRGLTAGMGERLLLCRGEAITDAQQHLKPGDLFDSRVENLVHVVKGPITLFRIEAVEVAP